MKELFRLVRICVSVRSSEGGICIVEATVKVEVDGSAIIAVGVGNDLLAALNIALGKALANFYPDLGLEQARLTEQTISVSGNGADTVAQVNVEIEVGGQSWLTVGNGDTIPNAALQALIKNYELRLEHRTRSRTPIDKK